MIGPRLRYVLVVSGLLGYVLVILLPAVALLVRAGMVPECPLPSDSLLSRPQGRGSDYNQWVFLVPSSRQWGLLLKTMGLAAAGALAALMLSLPGAYAVGGMAALQSGHVGFSSAKCPPEGRYATRPLLMGLIVLPLMLPPMVYAFGWQRLLGGYTLRHWSPLLRCVWIWASWSWPIPAIILGAGWSRVGRSAYESALLVATGRTAFIRAVIPTLWRHVLVSGLILFVLFLGEYSVPHANGVFVIASDLLDAAAYSEMNQAFVEVCRVSIPLIAVILGGLVLVRFLWPGPMIAGVEAGRIGTVGPSPAVMGVVMSIFTVTAALPIAAIAWRPGLGAEMLEALATYGHELLGTLAVCAGAGMIATLIGIAVIAGQGVVTSGITSFLVLTTLLAGIVPGAVIGQAVLAAYQPVGRFYELRPLGEVGWWIYNHWPIVVIGLTARFAWIGVLAAWLAVKTVPRRLTEQASTDGADPLTTGISLQLSQQWPTILCGMFLVGAMSMADIAVVSIVRVPSPTMVAMILMEKFHRFESGMLASLSLWLVACAVPCAILTMVALRRRD